MQKLINSLPYDIGKRPRTEADFYRICEKEKITVLDEDVSNSFYLSAMGETYIVIGKKLRGVRRLFAMFHELGHHFAHVGKQAHAAFSFLGTDARLEAEADAIALVALMPIDYLRRIEFLDLYPRYAAKKIYDERLRLYFLYGI